MEEDPVGRTTLVGDLTRVNASTGNRVVSSTDATTAALLTILHRIVQKRTEGIDLSHLILLTVQVKASATGVPRSAPLSKSSTNKFPE